MTVEQTSQTQTGGEPVQADGIPGEGITGFVVKANASAKVGGDLVSNSTELIYQFGRTVGLVDVVAVHAEQQQAATEMAEQVVAQRVAEKRAEKGQEQAALAASYPTPTPTAPAPAPAPVPAGTIPPFDAWPEGQKPNGRGTVKYLPTSIVPTDMLRAKIAEGIRANGDNPDLFAIFDERIGDRGFENGGQNYMVASIKPTDDHPARQDARFTTDKGYAKSLYYADFERDGSVKVKPTADYSTWLEVQRQVAAQVAAQTGGQPATAAAGDPEMPF